MCQSLPCIAWELATGVAFDFFEHHKPREVTEVNNGKKEARKGETPKA